MGYHTDFNGHFELDTPLDENQTTFLNAFALTRRMKRDVEAYLKSTNDGLYESVGLPIGEEGAYVADSFTSLAPSYEKACLLRYDSENDNPSIRYAINDPPQGQPGLWCGWVPSLDGKQIMWDESEKFYNYIEWIKYIIEHFLTPWGKTISGEVHFRGEEHSDRGIIFAKDNNVEIVYDQVVEAHEIGPSWAKKE